MDQAAHLEAEEQRISAVLAWEQDKLNWEKELKHAEGELQHLNERCLLVDDLKSELDTASTLLFNLKSELASYMEAKLNQEFDSFEEEELIRQGVRFAFRMHQLPVCFNIETKCIAGAQGH